MLCGNYGGTFTVCVHVLCGNNGGTFTVFLV